MKKMTFFIFFLILLLGACVDDNVHDTQAEQVWRLDIEESDTLLRHNIEFMEYLPLESSDNSMLFNVDKLIFKNEMFYLADFHSNKIVTYDREGSLKYVLDKRGEGPQEYLEIKNFAVDSLCLYTIDNYKHQMNVYNVMNGEFEKTLKLPFVAWDVEILPDGYFIFTYIPYQTGRPNMKQEKYRIFITDKDLQIKKKLFKYSEKQFDFISRKNYFTLSEQGIAFNTLSSDDFYIFVDKDSIRHIKLNINKEVPYSKGYDFDRIAEGGYNYFSRTPILHKNYLICLISQKDLLLDYIYNISTGSLSRNDYVNAYKGLLTPLFAGRGYLFSYLNDYDLYLELVEAGFTKADEKIETHLKNEGVLLLMYKLK